MRRSSITAWCECEKLALSVARRTCELRGLLHAVDEAVGVARMLLLRAVRTHDPDKAALTTYTYRVVQNGISEWLDRSYTKVLFFDDATLVDTRPKRGVLSTSSHYRMEELLALLSPTAKDAVAELVSADLPAHYRRRLLRPAAERVLRDSGYDVSSVMGEIEKAVHLVYG